ncbi:hypothetical protein DL766_008914 [Monosporascus sp. MC13-8B]|uniref:Hydrophobin n=1 Tax=Monosporascus cannonballus TaxID=155416 RepID=A0ABY0HJC4_9PEZI|nr:hypothetical protein DL762_000537 [Monosporascus cannonballus]RYO96048.1 hypothetical protein DL763_003440 [Monosporascus cannonballus]RYP17341.1 hypothetical protein DL766_008914 [Monosporascus sp. MC13-8B]
MHFSTALLTLVAGALAMPREPAAIPRSITVRDASNTCGEDLTLSCCNDVDQSGDSINEANGILGGLLQGALQGGELGLFSGCSEITVPVGVLGGAVGDLLNSKCKQSVACCQDNDVNQGGNNVGGNGNININPNVNLPCIGIGSIL